MDESIIIGPDGDRLLFRMQPRKKTRTSRARRTQSCDLIRDTIVVPEILFANRAGLRTGTAETPILVREAGKHLMACMSQVASLTVGDGESPKLGEARMLCMCSGSKKKRLCGLSDMVFFTLVRLVNLGVPESSSLCVPQFGPGGRHQVRSWSRLR